MAIPSWIPGVACLCLAACGGDGEGGGATPAAGRWRLERLGGAVPGTLQPVVDAMARHAPVAAVVALEPGWLGVMRQARREVPQTQWALVGVAAPGADAPTPDEVVLREPAAAPVAVELALLACHAVALPPRLHTGPLTGDGAPRPAPGDLALAMLRREHAAVLTTTPAIDIVFPLACVVWRRDGWHDRQRDEVVAAARRYPQLALTVSSADGTDEGLRAAVQQALAANVRALIVVADAWHALAPLVAACDAQRIVRIGIDPFAAAAHVTCSVGTDQDVLGRALGEAVRSRVPAGGTVLVGGDFGAAAPRSAGLAAALGVPAK